MWCGVYAQLPQRRFSRASLSALQLKWLSILRLRLPCKDDGFNVHWWAVHLQLRVSVHTAASVRCLFLAEINTWQQWAPILREALKNKRSWAEIHQHIRNLNVFHMAQHGLYEALITFIQIWGKFGRMGLIYYFVPLWRKYFSDFSDCSSYNILTQLSTYLKCLIITNQWFKIYIKKTKQ